MKAIFADSFLRCFFFYVVLFMPIGVQQAHLLEGKQETSLAKVSFSLAMLERNLRSFGRQGPTRPQALGIMMTALGEGGPAGSGGGGDFCINVSDVIMILYCVINKNILV